MTRQHIAIHCTAAAVEADFADAARVAREVRIARIRRIHARAVRNFKNAHFAYQIADSARAAAPKLSSELRLASELCARALRQMDHWCKRAYVFAREEIQLSVQTSRN